MKNILFTLLLLSSNLLFCQNVYYVATNGNDEAVGDLTHPWATWQKAFETAEAGDTVYFRGGVYMPETKATGGTGVCVIYPGTGHGHNGTWDAPIVYMNYPGEKPILDGSLAANADYGNIGLVIQYATNLKFIGLTFRNNPMMNASDNSGGVSFAGVDESDGNVYFENCEFYYNGGPGLWCRGYDTVYVINCDSHHNLDSLDASYGGGGDGFALSSRGEATDTFKLTVVRGCRSWNNSDDGFDIGSTKQIQFYNNWSWNNGYEGSSHVTGGGDGVGLKLSYSNIAVVTKRKVYNNIFAYNKSMDQTAGAGIAEVNLYDLGIYGPLAFIYNNTFYNNFTGFASSLSWGWANYPTDYYNDSLFNNLILGWEYDYQAYFRAVNYSQGDPSYVTLTTNTFYLPGSYGNCLSNPAYTVTSGDFIALPSSAANCTEILGASRQSDGSLPDIGNYFKLAEGSDMKAAGTDVGMTATPDIGVDWAHIDAGEPDPESATVLTHAITDYNAVQAVVGANVISDGGGTLTAKGVCYSTSENPTIADSKVSFPAGTGSSSIRLTTLKPGTTYHFRAYATNETGTSYGSDVSIKTPVHSTGKISGKIGKVNGKWGIVR